jgi:hypothetical protein
MTLFESCSAKLAMLSVTGLRPRACVAAPLAVLAVCLAPVRAAVAVPFAPERAARPVLRAPDCAVLRVRVVPDLACALVRDAALRPLEAVRLAPERALPAALGPFFVRLVERPRPEEVERPLDPDWLEDREVAREPRDDDDDGRLAAGMLFLLLDGACFEPIRNDRAPSR